MSRVSIQQFRSLLAAGAERDSDVRAYHEIARRPELTRGMLLSEWSVWTPAAAPQAAA